MNVSMKTPKPKTKQNHTNTPAPRHPQTRRKHEHAYYIVCTPTAQDEVATHTPTNRFRVLSIPQDPEASTTAALHAPSLSSRITHHGTSAPSSSWAHLRMQHGLHVHVVIVHAHVRVHRPAPGTLLLFFWPSSSRLPPHVRAASCTCRHKEVSGNERTAAALGGRRRLCPTG